MSKQVLVISASPRRKGNSDTLCDEFVRGARDAGHSAEKIFIRDKCIGYCTGCGNCSHHRATAPGCSIKDDMAEILDRMVRADVIVMATPIYFYTMDGQLKTLIDRTCPRYTELAGKAFYFILTAADAGEEAMRRALVEFDGFLYCLDDPEQKGVLRAVGVWNAGDVKGTPFMKQAYDMGSGV